MKGTTVADDSKRNPAIKDTFEEKFGAKKLPPKQRRIKQSVAHQIEEAFEDEAAVEEMSKEPSFWKEDEGPEFYEEEEKQAAQDYSDYLAGDYHDDGKD